MIYYHPDPLSLFYTEDGEQQPALYNFRLRSGGIMNAELLDGMRVRVRSIASTDPGDYMNPQWQPGQIIDLILL